MVDKFNFDYVKNLPDAYRKTPDSNNAKILEIERHEVSQLRESIADIYDSLDIDKATGKTLDLYGDMLGQKRGKANDGQYRIILKNRILRNLTNGDYNSVIKAICLVFGCNPSEVQLAEAADRPSVELKGLPYSAINACGLTPEDAIKIVFNLIPVGVKTESIMFEGTFEFGAETIEIDAAKGFGNIEQTTGGYFGFMASDMESTLPI